MASDILQAKSNRINAIVYVDYENIFELLKKYGKTPAQINFFPVLNRLLKEQHKLNIIDFLVYSNFERKNLFEANHQTSLQALGLQTRHSSNDGKNSGDLELTVDVLKTLYKNPTIEVFVIISSDRDIIPLLKAIKLENKVAYVLSTKIGFNQIISEYATCHQFIEDIFNLNFEMLKNQLDGEFDLPHLEQLSSENIEKAKEVSKLFYTSNIWRNYQEKGLVIDLNGYAKIVAGKVNRLQAEIIEDFKIAHHLQYLTIYKDYQKQKLCLKEGTSRNLLDI